MISVAVGGREPLMLSCLEASREGSSRFLGGEGGRRGGKSEDAEERRVEGRDRKERRDPVVLQG